MNRKLAVTAASVLALGAVGVGIALAAGGGDDGPLTGDVHEKAIAAALAYTGGGSVVETEVGDGRAVYGVEVRLLDGRTVEVGLDERFRVVGRETDEDRAGDRGDD